MNLYDLTRRGARVIFIVGGIWAAALAATGITLYFDPMRTGVYESFLQYLLGGLVALCAIWIVLAVIRVRRRIHLTPITGHTVSPEQ